jgi:hypothetical protein
MKTYKPKLTAMLPDGWIGRESITLLAPTGNANVIASSDEVNPTLNTKDYADAQVAQARAEFPGYRQLMLKEFRVFGGLPGYIHQFEWESDKGTVRQTQLYYVANGTVWYATATATSIAYEQVQGQLLEVLSGLSGPTE